MGEILRRLDSLPLQGTERQFRALVIGALHELHRIQQEVVESLAERCASQANQLSMIAERNKACNDAVKSIQDYNEQQAQKRRE